MFRAEILKSETDLVSDQGGCASKSSTPLSPTIPANLHMLASAAPIRSSEAGLAMGSMRVILSDFLMLVPTPAFPMLMGWTHRVLVSSHGTLRLVMARALEMLHAPMQLATPRFTLLLGRGRVWGPMRAMA